MMTTPETDDLWTRSMAAMSKRQLEMNKYPPV